MASEDIVCQAEKYGILVFLKLTGPAPFLQPGSIAFHPSNEQKMADAIYRAMAMDKKGKGGRYKSFIDSVSTHTR